jgi:hypothetical protein
MARVIFRDRELGAVADAIGVFQVVVVAEVGR